MEKEAETKRKLALIEAEKVAAVERVELERYLAQKQNEQTVAEIANEMHLAQSKAEADAAFYRLQREAEANKLSHTPEFIQLELARAIANNTKVYFGDRIPGMFLDLAGGLRPDQTQLSSHA